MRVAVNYSAPNTIEADTRVKMRVGSSGTTTSRIAVPYRDSNQMQIAGSRVAVKYGEIGSTTVTNSSRRIAVGYTASGNAITESNTSGSNINTEA